MTVERTNTDLLIRIPLSSDISEAQDIIDFFRYKEIVSKSKADENDFDWLTDFIKTEISNSIDGRVS